MLTYPILSSISQRILVSVFSGILLVSCGQERNPPCDDFSAIKVAGVALEEGGEKLRAQVRVLREGYIEAEGFTNDTGLFSYPLCYDSDYLLEFAYAGMVSKSVLINTHDIPQSERDRGRFTIPFTISLRNSEDVIPNEIFTAPVAKFSYQSAPNDIVYDKQYSDSIASLQGLYRIDD